MELEGAANVPGATPGSFDAFVLSTCVPSHVRAARKGVEDWVRDGDVYFSPTLNVYHHCDPETCTSWVIRFVDGVRICAISGRLLMPTTMRSPRKRELDLGDEGGKRHQDKAVPGSSAYLIEKFSMESAMQVDYHLETRLHGTRTNQYPYS